MGQFITPDLLPPDTFCRRLFIPNDPKWIGTISGALLPLIYASEWVQVDGITTEEAAERAKVMIDEFWADNGCGGDDMECCDDRVILHRFDPETGRPQVSSDGGETWTTDPGDVQNSIPLYPPLVGGGGGKTKCDAATNCSEHVNELIDATQTNLETAGTVFSLAVAIAEAVLGLFLILVSAGTLTAPVVAVATAIWGAGTAAFALGAEAFDAYWTVDKKDAILCAIYCEIGENGQFTEAQYQAFRTRIKATLPASPAFDIVMTTINAGGATGMSQMASYGNAALADCSSCDCAPCIDQCEMDITWYGVHDVVFDGCNTYTMLANGAPEHVAFNSGTGLYGCYVDPHSSAPGANWWSVESGGPSTSINPKLEHIWNMDAGVPAADSLLTFTFSSAPIV